MKLFIPTLAVLAFSTLILPRANADDCWLSYGVDLTHSGLQAQSDSPVDYQSMKDVTLNYILAMLSLTNADTSMPLSHNPAVYYRLEGPGQDLSKLVMQGGQTCNRAFYERLIEEGNYPPPYFVRDNGAEGNDTYMAGTPTEDFPAKSEARGGVVSVQENLWKVYYIKFEPTPKLKNRFAHPGLKYPF